MNAIFTGTAAGAVLSPVTIVVNLGLALVLSLAIAWVYKKTHRGLSYSQSFLFTLILVSIITATAMMVIGSNLAVAFGLLGAFSIIRFRTPVKDAKDTGYIFFSLVEGLAVGTGNYLVAVISTVVVLAVIFALHRSNFGALHKHEYLLVFTLDYQKQQPDAFSGIFEKYLKSTMLLNINAKEHHHSSEMVYSVTFIDESSIPELIKGLLAVGGVTDVRVISAKADIEY